MRLWILTTGTVAAFQASLPALIGYARTTLGWCSIVIGVLGIILPVLPGVPFLIIGGQLIGQRDPYLRRARVYTRLALRHLAQSETPALRCIGRGARQAGRQTVLCRRRLGWSRVPRRGE